MAMVIFKTAYIKAVLYLFQLSRNLPHNFVATQVALTVALTVKHSNIKFVVIWY